MSTWYDPQTGDERRAQLLRLKNLPKESQWLTQPSTLYQTYRDEPYVKDCIVAELRATGTYSNDPLANDHIGADAKLLWTWACRWHSGYEGYRHAREGRKK